MLPMQVVQCGGDFQADVGNFRIGQWQLGEPLEQRRSGDALHHNIGLHRKIAGGNELWHVHAGQARQDHLLHLKADDRRRVLAFCDSRYFHQHGHRRARP